MNQELHPNSKPNWSLLDLLDPVQLGVLYESLIKNGSDESLNSLRAKPYLEWAEVVKEGIEANYGFEDYQNDHQTYCRKLADYDGRMGLKV